MCFMYDVIDLDSSCGGTSLTITLLSYNSLCNYWRDHKFCKRWKFN